MIQSKRKLKTPNAPTNTISTAKSEISGYSSNIGNRGVDSAHHDGRNYGKFSSVRIIDKKTGNDYTPLSLLPDDKKIKEMERDTGGDVVSQQGSLHTQSVSSFPGANMTIFTTIRSKSQQSSSGQTADTSSPVSENEGAGLGGAFSTGAGGGLDSGLDVRKDSINFGVSEMTTAGPAALSGQGGPGLVASQDGGQLDDRQQQMIDIHIQETETIWMLDMAPRLLAADAENSSLMQQRNQAYEQLVASRAGNDRYVERDMGTFNLTLIPKALQTDQVGQRDNSTMVTNWDMYDSMHAVPQDASVDKNVEMKNKKSITGEMLPDVDEIRRETNLKKKRISIVEPESSVKEQRSTSIVGIERAPTQTTSRSDSEMFGTRQSTIIDSSLLNASEETIEKQRNEQILNSEALQNTLVTIERILNSNTYFEKLIHYRGVPYYIALMEELKLKPEIPADANLANASSSSLANGSDLGVTNLVDFTINIDDTNQQPDNKRQSIISTSSTRQHQQQTGEEAAKGDDTVNWNRTVRTLEAETQTPNVPSHAHLEFLWKFNCKLTHGRNISVMRWNQVDPDILAVGYGEFEFKENQQRREGLVCCWSVKNMEYPERVYPTQSGVTSIAWSKDHPNLLAIGMFNGVISIVDVSNPNSVEPLIDTTEMAGRHLGPVRQLEWIHHDSAGGGGLQEMPQNDGNKIEGVNGVSEVLVSICTDGRVAQWSIKRGFECGELMRLKRVTTSNNKVGGGGTAIKKNKQKSRDTLISQSAAGVSISFNQRDDAGIYLVGVEDGHIHKCSLSYNEQYLDNFFGHTAPVYAIQWSPFSSEVFLSCAADWTIKLWHTDHDQAVLNMQSAVTSVNSICWSPRSSVVFASVNERNIEVWDLQTSSLDPLIVETVSAEGIRATSTLFSPTSENLLVGDSDGCIHIYRLRNLNATPKNQMKALDSVIQASIESRL